MSTRPPFSLVLGGGGARGYIHLGVLKYLEENDMRPAEIVGTSMGAIVGAARAIGMSADEIIKIFASISRTSLFDVDFKTASIQGDQVERLLVKTLGYRHIEDMNLPFSCIATCLESGESTLFDSGSLIDAIRASISVPGIFSPQCIDEHTYIDGGLTANLPVQYASKKHIIAVSAARAQDLEIETKSQFWKREIPKNPLSINKEIIAKGYNLLLRTQEDQAIQLCSKKNITLIRPYNQMRLLDMDKIDQGIQLGYDEAERILGN